MRALAECVLSCRKTAERGIGRQGKTDMYTLRQEKVFHSCVTLLDCQDRYAGSCCVLDGKLQE